MKKESSTLTAPDVQSVSIKVSKDFVSTIYTTLLFTYLSIPLYIDFNFCYDFAMSCLVDQSVILLYC